jgi:hypothetical protein
MAQYTPYGEDTSALRISDCTGDVRWHMFGDIGDTVLRIEGVGPIPARDALRILHGDPEYTK